jgi:hypothetical protein
MKKIFFLLLLVPMMLLSESFLISNVPLPTTFVEDLDPYECDEYCMQEYIDNDMIFSFLSHAQDELQNSDQNQVRVIYTSLLNSSKEAINIDKVRIAILLPYKDIGKYTASTTNASFAYLLAKNKPFELKSYRIEDESVEKLELALSEIESDGISYVIAPLTYKGAKNIATTTSSINIFIPTLHKKQIDTNLTTLYFGAVDYEAQCDALSTEIVSPLIVFSDKSGVGKRLALYEEKNFKFDRDDMPIEDHEVRKYFLPSNVTNLEYYLKENERILEGTFFLNTPIVKTSMIMSQLTLYETNATKVLSTQINYSPLILSMTQYTDRKDMLIANSITEQKENIIQMNTILENDIVYDWINYSTTVGIDYFYSLITGETREYNIELVDNQLKYPIEIMQPMYSKFQRYFASTNSDFISR